MSLNVPPRLTLPRPIRQADQVGRLLFHKAVDHPGSRSAMIIGLPLAGGLHNGTDMLVGGVLSGGVFVYAAARKMGQWTQQGRQLFQDAQAVWKSVPKQTTPPKG